MKVFWRGLEPKIRTTLIVVTLLGLLYVPAWAIINRIVGSNIVAGDGLILGADGSDTLHVLTDWTMRINNDSTGIDTTNLWTLADLHYSTPATVSETLWAHLDDTSAVLWGAITDTAWALFPIMGDTARATWNDSIAAHWAAFTAGGDPGAAIHDSLDAHWSVFTAGEDGSEADIHDTLWAHLDDSIAILWTAITDTCWLVRQNTSDTLWAHLDDTSAVLWTAITDTAWMLRGVIHDSSWYYDSWGGVQLSVDWVASDSFEVFYPVSEKTDGAYTHRFFVRLINNCSTDDQNIKINFSGKLPAGYANDCDSVTVGHRSSSIDTTVTKINLQIFAQYVTGGFAPADTSKYVDNSFASGTTNTWDWQAIAGGSISAIRGNSRLAYEAICYVDVGDTIDIEIPFFHGMRK